MEPTAVVMGLVGFFLLYGGFVACIGVAYRRRRNENNDKDPVK